MKSSIIVDNIKCGGCAHRIQTKLTELVGIGGVDVDVEEGKVSFDYNSEEDRQRLLSVLKSMGYPEQGHSTGMDTARSYVSCMIGRVTK